MLRVRRVVRELAGLGVSESLARQPCDCWAALSLRGPEVVAGRHVPRAAPADHARGTQGAALVASRFLELQPGVAAAQPGAWSAAAREFAAQAYQHGASASFGQRVRRGDDAATATPWAPHGGSHERSAPGGVAQAAAADATGAHAAIKADMYPHRAVLDMAAPAAASAIAPEHPPSRSAAAAESHDRETEPPASNRGADTPSVHAAAESTPVPARAPDPAPAPAFTPGTLSARDAGAPAPSAEGAHRPPPSPERRASRVPVSTMERMARFTGLGLGIAAGTVGALVGNTLRGSYTSSGGLKGSVLSEANSERLTLVLCRMRGAALKFGQLLRYAIVDRPLLPYKQVPFGLL